MPELTEDQVYCTRCGEVTDLRAMLADPTNDEDICEPCLDDMDTADCDACGDTQLTDDLTHLGDQAVCDACFGNMFACSDCDCAYHSDDARYVGNWRSERAICTDCYENDYFYCEGCDTSYSLDVYGSDGYCASCDERNGCDCDECYDGGDHHDGIRRWGDTPDLQFWDVAKQGPVQSTWQKNESVLYGKGTPAIGKYYLGMEIELSHTSGSVVSDFVSAHHHMMWATTDATVSDGYEVVTMPLTFDAWKSMFPWQAWQDDIHAKVHDQSRYSDNGIHIHISRSAFANDKGKVLASHLYRFMQFIRVNEAAAMMIGGRGTHSYCQWDQSRDAKDSMNDAKASTSTRNYERYRPINTQNRQTIELRFFDGRSDPQFMMRAIEFVRSIAEFTRGGNIRSDRTWEAYHMYITEHSDVYPEMYAYLMTNGRRLLMSALTSEHKYKDVVMPAIKADKVRQLEQVRVQRERDAEARVERQRQIDRLSDPCDCDICNEVDGIPPLLRESNVLPDDGLTITERSRIGTPPREGDLIRRYTDGNFTVSVEVSAVGTRHVYSHSFHSDMDGQYTMAHPEHGYTGDVEQSVYNTETQAYESVTLQREAR